MAERKGKSVEAPFPSGAKKESIECQRWKDLKYQLVHAPHLIDEKIVLDRP